MWVVSLVSQVTRARGTAAAAPPTAPHPGPSRSSDALEAVRLEPNTSLRTEDAFDDNDIFDIVKELNTAIILINNVFQTAFELVLPRLLVTPEISKLVVWFNTKMLELEFGKNELDNYQISFRELPIEL
tara:strand:- start:223 stop:609 length:387 start_codon:yes stop_codon:yes gene_type:complete